MIAVGVIARPFVFAWHFLTAIPLSRLHHVPTGTELAASMAWYPVIGLLIGCSLAVADLVLNNLFTSAVGNVLLVVLLVLLTRGLHQDGLADTLDGLAGGRTHAERLSIMRDPRIGAIGATGLFLSLLLRYAGLLALPQTVRVPALLCMPVVGRWGMVTLAWLSSSARGEGSLAEPFMRHLTWLHVAISTGFTLAALAFAFGIWRASAMWLVGLAAVSLGRSSFRAWFGGVTGDTLGAMNECLEILFLLLIPLFLLLP